VSIMLVGKGLYLGSVSTLNGLVLVPFYVSVVPVLSLVFMRELWIWSRNAMRFDSSNSTPNHGLFSASHMLHFGAWRT